MMKEAHLQPHNLQSLGRAWALSSRLRRRRPGVGGIWRMGMSAMLERVLDWIDERRCQGG